MAQLQESLARSRLNMLNEKLDVKTREKWTQKHTNTAQVLNQVLRDRQFKDWEKRMKELEARGHIVRRTIRRLEASQAPVKREDTSGSNEAGPETPPTDGRPG